MIFSLKPVDRLIIGNGKPFNAGENYFRKLDGFNSVILNTILYSVFKEKIELIFFSKISGNLIFPFPLDYFYKFSKEKILKPRSREKIKEVSFIEETQFINYLKLEKNYKRKSKNPSSIEAIKVNIFNSKLEVGIEIDRQKRTTKEGKLYFQENIYLSSQELYENIEILIKLKDNIDISNNIFLKVGAENKVFNLTKKEEVKSLDNLLSLKNDIRKKITKYFKIILLTPTNYPPKIEGAKLVAQLVGKPITFSGWFNVYEEKSKKKIDSFPSRLFKLIPAGSVFYYKLTDENKLDDIFDKYWLKPAFFVKEYPYFEEKEEENPQSKEKIKINPLGFGLSIIGVAQVEE